MQITREPAFAARGPGEPPADAVEVLEEALRDEEPLVREHAAWALGKAG